jgi:hypothetical protein
MIGFENANRPHFRILIVFSATLVISSSALAEEVRRFACHLDDCCPSAQPCPENAVALSRLPTSAQQHGSAGDMPTSMNMASPPSFIDAIVRHETSGTSSEPSSSPQAMLMASRTGWMFMFHGEAFVNSIQQSGPRGGDKIFSTNWFMPMAQRRLGPGTFTGRVMVSLEPATISNERYPEVFQQGETAYGNPIVDGQHPHNFFMEIAAFYDWRIGENFLVSFYGAPVGDPALGPEAYPHRASAGEDPLAPLGHHLEDSTHISDDVVTLGLTYKVARVEVSGFHGREPDEFRWHIDGGALDSWSTRLTLNPTPHWSGQCSIGRLHSPEQLFPGEDTLRMTASVSYNHSLRGDWGNWATMLLWGRNQDFPSGEIYNGYLVESTVRFSRKNYAWTRIENVDRTNLLELGENPLPPGFEEAFLARIQAYTLGYDRAFDLIPHLSTAFGGQFMWYGKPAFLDPVYGPHPVGGVVFLRFRPLQSH